MSIYDEVNTVKAVVVQVVEIKSTLMWHFPELNVSFKPQCERSGRSEAHSHIDWQAWAHTVDFGPLLLVRWVRFVQTLQRRICLHRCQAVQWAHRSLWQNLTTWRCCSKYFTFPLLNSACLLTRYQVKTIATVFAETESLTELANFGYV